MERSTRQDGQRGDATTATSADETNQDDDDDDEERRGREERREQDQDEANGGDDNDEDGEAADDDRRERTGKCTTSSDVAEGSKGTSSKITRSALDAAGLPGQDDAVVSHPRGKTAGSNTQVMEGTTPRATMPTPGTSY